MGREPNSLYLDNQKLVPYLLNKYFPLYSQDEDMLQRGYIGLWKASESYDEQKGVKFTAYAGKVIMNEMRMELRHKLRALKHGFSFVSIDVAASSSGEADNGGNDDFDLLGAIGEYTRSAEDYVLGADTVAQMLGRLTRRQREVLWAYLTSDTQTEAAARARCSRNNLATMLCRIRERIQKYYMEDFS